MELEQTPQTVATEEPKKRGPKPKKPTDKAETKVKSEYEGDHVVFYLTDYSAMRVGMVNDPVRKNEQWPPRKLTRMSPANFHRAFSMNYLKEGRFINIPDAKTIISMFKNLDKETILRAVDFEIRKANSRDQERTLVSHWVNEFKTLKASGSNQVIASPDDILYCPGLDLEKTKFPENVIDE